MLVPLDMASVDRALDGALAAGAEAVAVCLLHAYLNPAHEHAVADAAKGKRPGLPVSCSADVVAEYREFERFSTTVLNAYLQPLMDAYLAALEERLLASGYAHGVLTVGSSGGMMTTDTARRLPIRTIFSGPAGGVSQACHVGATTGTRDFITYDMGGTSTDVCLVRDLHAGDDVRQHGRRVPGEGAADRHAHRRRRRRLHRLARRGRQPPGRAAQRGRVARARRRTASAAPSPPSPTPTSCSAASRARRRLGGSITIDPGRARGGGGAGRAHRPGSPWRRSPRASSASRWRA